MTKEVVCKSATTEIADGRRCTMSVPTPDSQMDIVGTGKPDAFVLDRFNDNPISFLNHLTSQPPIGRWEGVRV